MSDTLVSFVETGMSLIGASYTTEIDGVDSLNSHGLRRWNAAYGLRPIVLQEAWKSIRCRAYERKYKLKRLFWILYFLKNYDTEDNIASRFRTAPKTLHGKVKGMVKLLAQEMPRKVNHIFKIIYGMFNPLI